MRAVVLFLVLGVVLLLALFVYYTEYDESAKTPASSSPWVEAAPKGGAAQTPPPPVPASVPGKLTVGPGGFPTVAEAVAAAKAGDVITVSAGTYKEAVRIETSVEVVGEETPDKTVIECADHSVFTVNADTVRLANLTIRHTGTATKDAVTILHGKVTVENCMVTSSGHGGLVARGEGAHLAAIRNTIQGCNTVGVYVTMGARALLEGNTIKDCGNTCVGVIAGSLLTARKNTISGSGENGIAVMAKAAATLEGNTVERCGKSGIFAVNGAKADVIGNTTRDNKESGIWFFQQATGVARDNTVSGNGNVGIGCNDVEGVTLAGNRCLENGCGILIAKARVVTKGNQVTRNKKNGFVVQESSNAELCEDIVRENEDGVLVVGARAVLKGCKLERNKDAGLTLSQRGTARVEKCQIAENGHSGIYVCEKSTLAAEGNEIRANLLDGIAAHETSTVTARGNRIRDNAGMAIFLKGGSTANAAENENSGNRSMDPGEAAPGDSAGRHLRVQRAWALAASAILMERNGARSDMLAGYVMTKDRIEKEKKLLDDGWGIKEKQQLLDQIGILKRDGHNSGWVKMRNGLAGMTAAERHALATKEDVSAEDRTRIELVLKHDARFGNKGVRAFDYGRCICLARWGYITGMLTEAEAWAQIMPVARLILATFSSWREYGENFLVGREFWSPKNEQHEATYKTFDELLKAPDGTWTRAPWEVDLTPGPGEP